MQKFGIQYFAHMNVQEHSLSPIVNEMKTCFSLHKLFFVVFWVIYLKYCKSLI